MRNSRFMAAVPRCQRCRKFLPVYGTGKQLGGKFWHNRCYFQEFPEHRQYFGRGGKKARERDGVE